MLHTQRNSYPKW